MVARQGIVAGETEVNRGAWRDCGAGAIWPGNHDFQRARGVSSVAGARRHRGFRHGAPLLAVASTRPGNPGTGIQTLCRRHESDCAPRSPSSGLNCAGLKSLKSRLNANPPSILRAARPAAMDTPDFDLFHAAGALETSAMARLVMKFGGSAVADIARIRNVAHHVKREVDAGHHVAVVVSAMSGKTNELVAWSREAAPG